MNISISNRQAMQELKDVLCSAFPHEIEQVILFGSRVNGEAREYSDYDVLVIVNHSYDWHFEDKVYDTAWEIDFKHDIFTDVKVISRDELQTIKGKQPFIREALRTGEPL